MIITKTDPLSCERVVNAVLQKNIVIIPTDTVYGFSGIVPAAENAIRAIKGRDEHKPFIQLIAEPSDIYQYTDVKIPPALFELWPGAVTIIVPVYGTPGSEVTVGFRCPGDQWLRTVIRQCGMPLYSTSVNRSGFPLLSDISAMEAEFGKEVELIVDGGDCILADALPSTIVSVSSAGECTVIRQGSVTVPAGITAGSR